MILEANSQDKSSKPYYRTVTSEMCAILPRILNPITLCKRMHKMVGNVLSTILYGEPPPDMASAKEYINEALSIAMHAMRAAIYSTLGSSPVSLTFNRDIFLNIPLIADWHTISQSKNILSMKIL
jgi:hypothetical protein